MTKPWRWRVGRSYLLKNWKCARCKGDAEGLAYNHWDNTIPFCEPCGLLFLMDHQVAAA